MARWSVWRATAYSSETGCLSGQNSNELVAPRDHLLRGGAPWPAGRSGAPPPTRARPDTSRAKTRMSSSRPATTFYGVGRHGPLVGLARHRLLERDRIPLAPKLE